MARGHLDDLQAFLAIAREGSFARAAARLGLSPSALSHTIRALEERLRVRLLTRTTRRVSPTEAGARLIESIGPRFAEIDAELEALSVYRDRPAGTIRLTAGEHSARTVIWPKLSRFLTAYPDINVEVNIENGLTDIVAERYDAGVRLGEQVARDMVAVRIGPDWGMAIVASPTYLADHPRPRSPHELTAHRCINLKLVTYGGLYAWEFEKQGQKLNVRVDGQLAFNSSQLTLAAAIDGYGFACVPEDMAKPHIAAGALRRVLKDWCPKFVGYHLYYPSRRQSSKAFSLLVDALRHRP